MTLGPLMIGIAGPELTGEERERLRDPAVGGVILFARNFHDVEQLAALTEVIRALRTPPLLIAADQEGGRVQRFRDGFTALPPARALGAWWRRDRRAAAALAEQFGWLVAAELRGAGVDLGLGPVLDIDHGVSAVIGDRALGDRPQAVAELGLALARGLRRGGMAAVAKHFPGHGGVAPDSHEALPEDGRDYQDLHETDLLPFRRLMINGLEGLMMAHVVFPREDSAPASLSARWIQGIVRRRLGFEGAVFSDDLGMAGAAVAGSIGERVRTALDAGCDIAVLGNEGRDVDPVLPAWRERDPVAAMRRMRLHGRAAPPLEQLRASREWQQACEALARLTK